MGSIFRYKNLESGAIWWMCSRSSGYHRRWRKFTNHIKGVWQARTYKESKARLKTGLIILRPVGGIQSAWLTIFAIFTLVLLPAPAFCQSNPAEFVIPPPPVPTSSFTYPFPDLPPASQIFSSQSSCREAYTTCIDAFQDCLRAAGSFNGAPGANLLCEQWREGTCEGGIRVNCDKLPPENQRGTGDGGGGGGGGGENGQSSSALSSDIQESSTNTQSFVSTSSITTQARSRVNTEQPDPTEQPNGTGQPITTTEPSPDRAPSPTLSNSFSSPTSSVPTLPPIASSDLPPTTLITSIFNTDIDITTFITFTTVVTTMITTQTTLTTTVVNTDADGGLETMTMTTTMEIIATTTVMDRGLRFVGDTEEEKGTDTGSGGIGRRYRIAVGFELLLICWTGIGVMVGFWTVGGFVV